MKSFIRLGATLGIAGTVFLTGLSGIGNLPGIGNQEAIALPQDQMVKKLQEIPVFTLVDPKGGLPILTGRNASKTVPLVVFFISKQDAQKFLDNRLRQDAPKLASTLQVRPLSLAEYYQIVEEGKKKKDSVIYTLEPTQQQVESATTILNQNGKKGQQFNGIPLFVPKFKKDNRYLTIPLGKGNERYIPFYFEKEQAVAVLEEFKKAVPQEAANTEIQVVDLYGVINALNTSNDPIINKIVLYPSRESINFFRSLAPNQAPAAKPAAAPAPKK
ncbi:Tic22 family protein [Nostoc commune NIES-4072]|uniref:Tic22 family protein n=1 Tax=Nostoc commune NIES-4072 TaxID=2005467 RepID=A0A2R5FZD9_NOSCO|nr:Tic22 family protein [Nostoc commune]BBD67807.1 Tic22 family protein [Nostoc commune HK-02]GBG21211.1 Tic22 family protein [Nostoc commune NIES-4072]